ncbi:glycosyl hydrolase 108 family protein [Devosia sp.]|uniref:glycosyl hydrolase 108 family protein n=1 Tax=Devosia sp. TaxID=1871048 RepID=UPI00345B87F8
MLVHEGCWADHTNDPGGATMKGVTLATYRQYRPAPPRPSCATFPTPARAHLSGRLLGQGSRR